MPLIALPLCSRFHDYDEAIRRAGGEVRVLDPSKDDAAAVVREVDAVVLPGGGDVDPLHYGEARHPSFDPAEAGRDAFELALAREARDADRPLLAICRGMQVLNVARGGTLVQDLPDQVPSAGSHVRRDPLFAIAHDVWVTSGSLLERLLAGRLEDESCAVNSRHHQAIRQLGAGLVVTATAPDGVIEAVEDPSRRFCVGVQWHPENFYRTGDFSGLFEGLVRESGGRRSGT